MYLLIEVQYILYIPTNQYFCMSSAVPHEKKYCHYLCPISNWALATRQIFASLKQWYYRLLMWTNSNYKALYLIKKYFLETSWLSLFLSHALYILISFSFIPILCNTLSNSLWCSWGHSSYLAFCWGTEKWQEAWVFQLTWLCSEWSQIQITVSRAN